MNMIEGFPWGVASVARIGQQTASVLVLGLGPARIWRLRSRNVKVIDTRSMRTKLVRAQ